MNIPHHSVGMNLSDQIVVNLSRILKEKKLKITVVSEKAELGRNTLKNIIDRRSMNPSYSTLVALAKAMEVEVHEITGGSDEAGLTDQDRRIIYAMRQLRPELRDFLLSSAEAQAQGQDLPPLPTPPVKK